jgi:hypothetical protein
MPTIHDDIAATWHDLTDQLTPEQVSRIDPSRDHSYRRSSPAIFDGIVDARAQYMPNEIKAAGASVCG